ncbi:MAG: hypothetical protein QOK38_786 [Acidobacteriaceae bacterium]|nr:hypothetical protein [Acidobacteriaceae bacterium]
MPMNNTGIPKANPPISFPLSRRIAAGISGSEKLADSPQLIIRILAPRPELSPTENNAYNHKYA